MVRRAALSLWPVPEPGRRPRAWRLPLIVLAIALVTTLAGSISSQATLEAGLIPPGTVLSPLTDAAFTATEQAPFASWRAAPDTAPGGRTLWAHAAKVKRAAARAGHRGSRWLVSPVPDRVRPVAEPMVLASTTNHSSARRKDLLLADRGHPLRAPPADAD